MNTLCGGCDRLGVGLRPMKVAREPLKKLIDLMPRGGLVLRLVWPWVGRIRMVLGHRNLVVNVHIVGEFVG
jgi:hypothetical protein